MRTLIVAHYFRYPNTLFATVRLDDSIYHYQSSVRNYYWIIELAGWYDHFLHQQTDDQRKAYNRINRFQK